MLLDIWEFLLFSQWQVLYEAKRSFYRAANAIFGKIGRLASEEVTLHQAWTGHCAIVPWHRRPPLRRTQAPPGPFEIF